VGGRRQRYFTGTNFRPRKLPDCLQGVRTLSLRAARFAATSTTAVLPEGRGWAGNAPAYTVPEFGAGVHVVDPVQRGCVGQCAPALGVIS